MPIDSDADPDAGHPRSGRGLKDQIAHLSTRRSEFVILAMHHPPVADIQTKEHVDHNPRPNEIALRDYLSQVAPQSHTRFIVAPGHIHNYERAEVDGVTFTWFRAAAARILTRWTGRPQDKYQRGTDFPNFHYVRFELRRQHAEPAK